MTTNQLKLEEDFYYFDCPHCDARIQLLPTELNCRIFRHGVFKANNQQINPHLPKEQCDLLFSTGQIYGCSKPFKVISHESLLFAVMCDYI